MDRFVSDASKAGPFFLYMAEYAVHLPLQALSELAAPYAAKNAGKKEPDPVYAAMVQSVDTALGNLSALLAQNGVAENTIIILTSDNGGVGFQGRSLHRVAHNGPFRAGKGFLYEGGIREPLLVHWPGVTTPGSICDAPMIGMDFYAHHSKHRGWGCTTDAVRRIGYNVPVQEPSLIIEPGHAVLALSTLF